jgi:hypothetical protein
MKKQLSINIRDGDHSSSSIKNALKASKISKMLN